MKKLIPVLIVLLVAGCGKTDDANIGAVKPDLPLPKVTPVKLIEDPDLELAIRFSLKKSTGTLTEYDLRKVTELDLGNNKMTELPMGLEKLTKLERLNFHANQLTDVKGLEELTQLKYLSLWNNQLSDLIGLNKLIALEELNIEYNPDLTKALIDELQKALPNCEIIHNTE